jgi:hypothetical protein
MKTSAQAMEYEVSGNKGASKGTGKRVAIKSAESLSTSRLLWILVTRHKVALLALGNIVLVLNWAIPEWTTIVVSLVK